MWITKTKTRKPGVLPCGVWIWTRYEAKRKNGGPGDIKMKDMAGAILWANPNAASFTSYMENLYSNDE